MYFPKKCFVFLITLSCYENYYLKISSDRLLQQKIKNANLIISYPNILLISHSKDFFIAELIGTQFNFKGLTIKIHYEASIYRYLNQFSDERPDPEITFQGAFNGIQKLTIAHQADLKKIKERFPFIRIFESVGLTRTGGQGCPIGFTSNFKSCFIEKSILISKHKKLYRCKYIFEMLIISNSVNKSHLKELIKSDR